VYSLICENGRPSAASHFYSISLKNAFIIPVIILLFVLCSESSPSAQSPLSGFNPASLIGASNGIFLAGKTFWGGNALPLRAIFFDEWDGPFRPDKTNRSDNYWKTDAGLIHNGWRLAFMYRGELFMEANKDTIEILRMVNLKEELPVGRVFDINLKAHGFSAKGVELSRGISLDGVAKGLSAGFTARYLIGERIQEGKLVGEVTPTGPMTYDFNLPLDYIYDENFIYNRRGIIQGSGNGYSFDVGVRYLFSEKFSAEVLLRDIGGRIYWKDVPFTTANATSNVGSYDEQGYQIYRPTIQGYEGYKDFNQKIPSKTDIAFSYQKGAFILSPTVNLIEGRPLYWIDLGYKTNENVSIMIGYNINYQTFSIGGAYKTFLLNIYSSDVDLRRTNAIGLILSVNYYL